MSITYDVTATLRQQMKHHEPIVLIRGGDVPMIVQTLVFDESQITFRQNGNHPTWGGCAILSTETQTEQL